VNSYSGVLFLHAVPKASSDSVDEILLRLKIRTKPFEWSLQPLVLGCIKTVVDWTSQADLAPHLVSELSGISNIRFEVTLNQSKQQTGRRWLYSPGLGIFASAVDEAGNLMIAENQLRNALYGSGNDLLKTQAALRKLLGTAWDDDLERFREQAYDSQTRMAGWG